MLSNPLEMFCVASINIRRDVISNTCLFANKRLWNIKNVDNVVAKSG